MRPVSSNHPFQASETFAISDEYGENIAAVDILSGGRSMKLLPVGILIFAFTFCGLGDRLKNIGGSSNSGSDSGSTRSSTGGSGAEQPTLTPEQQSIQNASSEVKWDAQGISWKVPTGWPQMQMQKESANFGAPGVGFLIGTISVMPASFPAETSLDATYTQALDMLKQGKYEKVRWLEIDGVKGVEWIESMPESKDGPRRHQWIAFRNFQGQNQQLNIMVSTDGNKFDARRDTFASIMYSMKIAKG